MTVEPILEKFKGTTKTILPYKLYSTPREIYPLLLTQSNVSFLNLGPMDPDRYSGEYKEEVFF
jgi:hypothetical protein